MAPQMTMGLPMGPQDLYPIRPEQNTEQSNQQRGFMGPNLGGHTQTYNFMGSSGNQTLQLHLNNNQYWFFGFGKILKGLSNQIMNRPTNLPGGVHHDVHWYEKSNAGAMPKAEGPN